MTRFFALTILVICLCCTTSVCSHELLVSKNQDTKEVIRLALIGDSITFGAKLKNRAENSYPAQLAKMLGNQWQVNNYGASGHTLLKKGNKPYWNNKKLQQAYDFNPNIVVITLGTNDTKAMNWQFKDEFVNDYLALINSFKQLTSKAKVYICYPVPAFSEREGKISGVVIKQEILPLIDLIAQQASVKIIDLHTPMLDKSALFPDTVHPNKIGASLIAQIVKNTLITQVSR